MRMPAAAAPIAPPRPMRVACRPAVPSGLRILLFLAALYVFFVSIDLMGAGFKLMGSDFAAALLHTAAAPLAGLLIGILVTSIVQSSSFTTSLVVGLVAAGTIPLRVAIPMLMGANVGTTVTNTIVSLGHVTRRREFERAFAAGTVHDLFNLLAVLVFFPIECLHHPIERLALLLEEAFLGVGGIQLVSPLQWIVKPATKWITHLLPYGIPVLLLALAGLFAALTQMVRVMRNLVMTRFEAFFDRVLFRNDFAGFMLGWLLTTLVQSSSATTSLIVPLVGTGVLTVRRIYPYTMGANLGTTITAILASFATGSPAAITVAFAHMIFNLFGIAVFYPLRAIPIGLANRLGRLAGRSRRNTMSVVIAYVVIYAVPILYLALRHTSER